MPPNELSSSFFSPFLKAYCKFLSVDAAAYLKDMETG
jgi:hypothetical protein